MSLSAEQREARKFHIGSSEVASIFCENPWQSSYDLWLIKTGRASEFEGNTATRRGQYLESGLVLFAEETLGHPIERNITFIDPAGSPLAANLDGLCRPLDANVEAKSVSGELDPEEWGEPWSDSVPSRVILQTHAAMMCAELSISYVPVVLPIFKRFQYMMFEVKKSDDLCDAIRERCCEFWELVKSDTPPSNSVPSIEVLRRIRREPGVIADISDDLVTRWEDAKGRASEAKKEAEAAQAAILAAMEPINADGARTETGRLLTFLETNRKAYTCEATSFRTLRLKGRRWK